MPRSTTTATIVTVRANHPDSMPPVGQWRVSGWWGDRVERSSRAGCAAYNRVAWESNAEADIRGLFAEHAIPRAAGRGALDGHSAIVAGWLEHADAPGETEFESALLAIDGISRSCGCVSTYPTGAKSGVYDNLWVIRFAADGRAEELSDWWIERPAVSGS